MNQTTDTPAKSVTVFVSYCHKNKAMAQKIDKDLSGIGISIIRDEHQLQYTDSLSEFMKRIRRADFALLLISDDYLKSKNCLFEIGQLLKDENVWNKILPVIAGKTDIYTLEGRIGYLKYWKDQQNRAKTVLAGIDPVDALSSLNELKVIGSFCGFIDEFLSKILDIFHVDYSTLINENYRHLFNKLGITGHAHLTELFEISQLSQVHQKDIGLEEYQIKFGGNTYYYSLKAQLENDLGRFEKAKYAYLKALEFDPQNSYALNNLGYLYHMQFHDFEKAYELYQKSLKINPDFIVPLLNFGILNRQLERIDQAIALFEHVLGLDSGNYQAHQNLANIYSIERLDEIKAEAHYRKALKYTSDPLETLTMYGNFLKGVKKEIAAGNKVYKKAKKYARTPEHIRLLNIMLKSTKG